MAQDYTPLFRSIWTDPDFRALTPDEQLVYLMLMSSADRDEAGLLVLSPRRWARQSNGMTAARVNAALDGLDAASFLVVDRDTDEVLVRAHIRRAKVYTHIRLLRNALRRAARVESERLRSALGQELARLPRLSIPERSQVMADEARTAQQELDDLTSQMCDAPPDPPGNSAGQEDAHGMGHGMADGMGHPIGVGAGTGAGVGVGAVRGSCSSAENESLEGNARAKPLTGLCRKHPGQPSRNCSGCAADRKAAS